MFIFGKYWILSTYSERLLQSQMLNEAKQPQYGTEWNMWKQGLEGEPMKFMHAVGGILLEASTPQLQKRLEQCSTKRQSCEETGGAPQELSSSPCMSACCLRGTDSLDAKALPEDEEVSDSRADLKPEDLVRSGRFLFIFGEIESSVTGPARKFPSHSDTSYSIGILLQAFIVA